jgi:endonuclease/exonuclease/phosphatase (EEP) superfamily protein YafD
MSESERPSPQRRDRGLVERAVQQIWRLTVVACALSLVGFVASFFWLAELLCHFRVQYAVCLAAAAIVFALTRYWRRMMLASICAALNGALVVPLFVGHPGRPAANPNPNTPTWRVLEANLLRGNTQTQRAITAVRELRPDVAVFLEADTEWFRALRQLNDELPYHVAEPREGAFGVALYSRHPILESKTLALGDHDLPAILAQLDWDGQRVAVLAIHVLPPISPTSAEDRNRSLRQAARIASEHSAGPCLLVGDFNCTSWSPVFREVTRTSGLHDSQPGFGFQPTWPTHLPIVLIPIDHCLVSSSVVVHRRFIGPAVGSDHLPLVLDVSLAP